MQTQQKVKQTQTNAKAKTQTNKTNNKQTKKDIEHNEQQQTGMVLSLRFRCTRHLAFFAKTKH